MAGTELLRAGCTINIQRTDGRVHSACISSINYEQNCATVEWYERGETKGKDIDLKSIWALNPDLVVTNTNTAKTNEIQRKYSESSEDEEEEAPAETNMDEDEDEDDNEDLSGALGSSYRQKLSESRHIANIANEDAPAAAPAKPLGGSMRLTLMHRPMTINQNNGVHETTIQPKESTLPSKSSNASAQNVKTSNVVKEVEKLKKNREERRQRQAEEKAEREAFMQMAPGNPHWELLNMIMEYRRGLDIKPLSINDSVEDHLITVCVRKRPLNKKEVARKEVDVITIPSKNQMIVHEPKNKVDLTKYLENQVFKFDYAFDETCNNEIVYRYTAQPLIKTVFDGGFATCFAYGQTGSGKTHTMGGNFVGKNQDPHKGIYAMAAADVFKLAQSQQYRGRQLVVAASFFEIYSGKVFDLLNNKQRLRILEDGKQQVVVVGLTETVVNSTDEVLQLIQTGNQARTSGQTSANSNSSRSHAVFQIILRSSRSLHEVHGKFSLIDLAGNERGADTSSANRGTRMEGAEINKSLLALKECIRALGRKGAHLPFRVSKLTQVLRDSFVGNNSRTCMIAMISPGVSSCEHTLNTLRYADRVKELGAGDLQLTQAEQDFNDRQQDGDLLHLRSLNENDMTPEMLNFHQVVSELEASEERLIENHKHTIQQLKEAVGRADKILRTTDDVLYDHEVYCKNWQDLIEETMQCLAKAKESVTDYTGKLVAEEQLSRKNKLK